MALIVGIAAIGVAGCGKSEQSDDQTRQYTCSMHPDVAQNKPGNCPKCGMKLVEKH